MTFLHRQKAASLTEMGLLIGLIAVVLIGALSSLGTSLAALFGTVDNALINAERDAEGTTDPEEAQYASCLDFYQSGDSDFQNNGVNQIYPNGATSPISVWCQDGKTLIAAQFENDPVFDWNEGIQADYDPTLATQKGFALSTSEIPSQTKIYFGAGTNIPDYCILATYHTGAYNNTTLYPSCDNAATTYYLTRYPNGFWEQGNPDNGNYAVNPEGAYSIGLELHADTGVEDLSDNYNWAFVPAFSAPESRGFSYNGLVSTTVQSYAWTIWVE